MIPARVHPSPPRHPAAVAALTITPTLLASPALAAEGGHGPSEFVFVAQLVLLMLVGRVLGEAMIRIKQPGVMGQLIAGLVLGPSVLGALAPDWQQAIFP